MAYITTTSNSSGASSTTTSLNMFVGGTPAQNDITIITWINSGSGTSTITWPSGFTEFVNASNTSYTYKMAWKREGASPGQSYTVTTSTPSYCMIIITSFSGRSTTTAPTAVITTQSTSQTNPITISATGISALAGDDIAWFVGLRDGSGSALSSGVFTIPSSYTSSRDIKTSTTITEAYAYRNGVSAGNTGTLTGGWNFSGSSSSITWSAVVVAIPAASTLSNKQFMLMGVG